ncbi:hypothetical protein OIU84_007962 [Salix udensis]|uniref:At1g61320/AtMIF1 LRR domain-containing protein n=1 Tax=Salix udensis TaxID=889485 RepID=A0AAD6NZZ0_9ROSI|nr:hypothetical protein OIU84_007962 [Salix udensis]
MLLWLLSLHDNDSKKLAAKDGIPKDFLTHNLKHLELQAGYTQYDLLGMAALLELCPNLETMILDPLYKIDDDVSILHYSCISNRQYVQFGSHFFVVFTILFLILRESLSEELLNKPIHFSIPSLKEVKLKVIPRRKSKSNCSICGPLKKSKELSGQDCSSPFV